jgi:hypothetical protein
MVISPSTAGLLEWTRVEQTVGGRLTSNVCRQTASTAVPANAATSRATLECGGLTPLFAAEMEIAMKDTFANAQGSKTLFIAGIVFFAAAAMNLVGAVVYRERLLFAASSLFLIAAVMLLASSRRK